MDLYFLPKTGNHDFHFVLLLFVLIHQDDDNQVSDAALQPTQAFAVPSSVAKREEDVEEMDTDDSMAEEATQPFTKPVMNSTQNGM